MISPIGHPAVVIVAGDESVAERRRCPACEARKKERWSPPSTGNEHIDFMLRLAWAVGRKVGMEDDPGPHHSQLVAEIEGWRQAHGLPPLYNF